MKLHILLFLIPLLLSCKKCFECVNECYYCTNGFNNDTYTICNNVTPLSYKEFKEFIEINSSNCNKVNSTVIEYTCDKESVNFFENNRLFCNQSK